MVQGQLKCLLPIGHRFLFKRFSGKLGGHHQNLDTSESSASQFQEAILTR